MKSFKIVAVLIVLSVSVLVFLNNDKAVTEVQDEVGTSAAAPKINIPF